jgi:hypothetical protein
MMIMTVMAEPPCSSRQRGYAEELPEDLAIRFHPKHP